MDEKKIRERFAPVDCETQMQFEKIMEEMNYEQSQLNRPLLDRERELKEKVSKLRAQKSSLDAEIHTLNVKRLGVEQELKDMNRLFHDLKHALIVKNPREKISAGTGEGV